MSPILALLLAVLWPAKAPHGELPHEFLRPAAALHDLHVSYGNLGVEGSTAVLQLRIFKDDLEEALRRATGEAVPAMEATPEMDRAFLDYFSGRFQLEYDGEKLQGRIIGSGLDELDREPVWWYRIAYDAEAVIDGLRVTNTLLFELFPDQRNVLRVAHFPEGNRRAYYFASGEETAVIEF